MSPGEMRGPCSEGVFILDALQQPEVQPEVPYQTVCFRIRIPMTSSLASDYDQQQRT